MKLKQALLMMVVQKKMGKEGRGEKKEMKKKQRKMTERERNEIKERKGEREG